MLRAHTLTLTHANMHSDTRAVHVRVCLSDGGDRKEGGGQAGGWEEKRGSKRKVSEQGQREVTGAGGITGKREIWHDEEREARSPIRKLWIFHDLWLGSSRGLRSTSRLEVVFLYTRRGAVDRSEAREVGE